jgi:hypothetical protein
MKTLTASSLVALGLASTLPDGESSKIDVQRLLQLATAHIQNVEEFLGEDEICSGISSRNEPQIGLRMGTLATARLQPAAGMGFASGLTPIDEWRRMFPRQEQR